MKVKLGIPTRESVKINNFKSLIENSEILMIIFQYQYFL